MWRHPRTAVAEYDWARPELYQHIARVCERGEGVLEIVGPDEVEPARRHISVASPVARALLGKRVGNVVVLQRP